MRIRHILILLSATALLALTGCSTTGDADKDDQTATAQQAQTEQQDGEQADEETEGRTKVGEADSEEADGDEASDAETPAEAAKRRKMKGMCPMKVEGTTRSVEKLDGAVAVNFTTTSDVDALRKRVTKMAQMHNKHHGEHAKNGEHAKKRKRVGEGEHAKKGKKGEHAKKHKGKGHHKMMKMMANTTAQAEEIDGGMRLKLSSDDADQLDKIHQKMQEPGGKDGCPMMHMKKAKADTE